MRDLRKVLPAFIAFTLIALMMAHPALGEQAPDEAAASWLSSLSTFFTELLSNMSMPYVSTVGEEDFIPSGMGIIYNVTWFGEYERLSALVTYVNGVPYRIVAVLRVRSSAPWHPYPTMIDVFDEVTSYYGKVLGNYSPDSHASIGSYDRYWTARYPSLEEHKIYVGLGKPAQVLVALKEEYGIIELVIADQLGPIRKAGKAHTTGVFVVNESTIRERFCGEACMVEGIWLFINGSLRPVYVVRSFSDGMGSVRVIDASTESTIYEASWLNEEVVYASPRPPSGKEIIANIVIVSAIAISITAVAAAIIWHRRHPGEGFSNWVVLLVIAVLLSALLVSLILLVGLGGIWSSICSGPPGGLFIYRAEDLDSTGKVVYLGFSSGQNGFTVLKLVAFRGSWVSECVKCVFTIPPNSVGNTTVVFDGIPQVIGGSMRVGVYGYPIYMTHPYIYLEWRRCGD